MNLGMPEMIFIFLLALVIFGPKKLPELGRQLGKALTEFKKASNEFKSQLENEMLNIELEERRNTPSPAPETTAASETPRILPAEKLFDTVSVPPFESIPRAPLPLPDPPALAASPAEPPAAAPVSENPPVAPAPAPAPEVPSQNA